MNVVVDLSVPGHHGCLALRTLFLSVQLLAVTPPSLPHLILRGQTLAQDS